ncbi:MAG: CoA-binding protein [Anaerolineae bacterium]|nr:CoA-binding protein [Anaerolineae bacterium]MBN8617919.1 CoA-binding protein [Anaerolineae bacterium]
MTSTLNTKVEDFLGQKRIAIVGVSRQEGAANMIYRRFRDNGYEVFPVNPNAQQVEGVTCYAHVQDIPGKVDGAVIVTRADVTEQVVKDCDAAGIKRVWMHGGVHGPGSSVSEAAVAYCDAHQISVIAGACPLMFGKTSDGGHRFIRQVFGLFGRLPN